VVALAKQFQYFLDLDGKPCCRCASVDVSPTLAQVMNPSGTPRPVSVIQVGPIIVGFNGGLGAGMVEWIGNTLARNHSRKNGKLSAVGPGNVSSCIEFSDALLTEVRIPAVGSSSGSAELRVKIQPEGSKNSPQPFDARSLASYGPASTTPWNTGKFRLTINGLERECAAVKSIDPWVINQNFKMHYTGNDRFPLVQAAKADSSQLLITVPTSSTGGFRDWMNGKTNGPEFRSGSLEYFPPGSKSPFRFKFRLGLSSMVVSQAGSQFTKLEFYFDNLATG
jgi:hypothetical protein